MSWSRYLLGSDRDGAVTVPINDEFRRARRNHYFWSLAAILVGFGKPIGDTALTGLPIVGLAFPPVGLALGVWLVATYMAWGYWREFRPVRRSMLEMANNKDVDSVSSALDKLARDIKGSLKDVEQARLMVQMGNVHRKHLIEEMARQMDQLALQADLAFNAAIDAGHVGQPDTKDPADRATYFEKAYREVFAILQNQGNDIKSRILPAQTEAAKVFPEQTPPDFDPEPQVRKLIADAESVLRTLGQVHDNIALADRRNLGVDHALWLILYAIGTFACWNRVVTGWIA